MGSTNPTKNGDFCVAPMEKKRILFRVDAVADPMSVATARLPRREAVWAKKPENSPKIEATESSALAA